MQLNPKIGNPFVIFHKYRGPLPSMFGKAFPWTRGIHGSVWFTRTSFLKKSFLQGQIEYSLSSSFSSKLTMIFFHFFFFSFFLSLVSIHNASTLSYRLGIQALNRIKQKENLEQVVFVLFFVLFQKTNSTKKYIFGAN